MLHLFLSFFVGFNLEGLQRVLLRTALPLLTSRALDRKTRDLSEL
jgi:hypothetical protein